MAGSKQRALPCTMVREHRQRLGLIVLCCYHALTTASTGVKNPYTLTGFTFTKPTDPPHPRVCLSGYCCCAAEADQRLWWRPLTRRGHVPCEHGLPVRGGLCLVLVSTAAQQSAHVCGLDRCQEV